MSDTTASADTNVKIVRQWIDQHDDDSPEDSENAEWSAFHDLAGKMVQVPKDEIDIERAKDTDH